MLKPLPRFSKKMINTSPSMNFLPKIVFVTKSPFQSFLFGSDALWNEKKGHDVGKLNVVLLTSVDMPALLDINSSAILIFSKSLSSTTFHN